MFKKHAFVIVAFALPILLIVGIALSIYLPSAFLSTDYDFVYATCDAGRNDYYDRYDCDLYLDRLYAVENGRLIKQDIPDAQDTDKDGTPDVEEGYITRLFLHDTESNTSTEITFEEAQEIELSGLITSPDGVSVEGIYSRSAEFFPLFGGSSQYGYYLTKGDKHTKLNLINEENNYYYRNNFKFIGWIVPGSATN